MYENKGITLKDHEILTKLDKETGEITEIKKRPNNIPTGKVVHYSNGLFTKFYDKAWDYLLDNLTDTELRIVTMMMRMSRVSSNSLEPLSNTTTSIEIAETFHIHRNHVNKIFNNLIKHGVYAEFRFGAHDGIRHYWVLNPYISFKGKLIDEGIADLFRETTIAKLCLE